MAAAHGGCQRVGGGGREHCELDGDLAAGWLTWPAGQRSFAHSASGTHTPRSKHPAPATKPSHHLHTCGSRRRQLRRQMERRYVPPPRPPRLPIPGCPVYRSALVVALLPGPGAARCP